VRVELCSFLKLASRFVFLSAPLQSQSELKMCRRILGHGADRRAKVGNGGFKVASEYTSM